MNHQNKIFIKYEDVKPYIKEADILLFHGDAWYSWFIQKVTQSEYSHVALASWHNGKNSNLECVEFHGFRGGGAIINLDNYFPEQSGLIDVYRPASHYDKSSFDVKTCMIINETIVLDAKAITNTMRHLTGLKYGWKRIWWFIKKHLFGLRLCYNLEDLTSDDLRDIIYPVCSTAVSYSFTKNNFDLIKNKNDAWTAPGNIGESPLLNYMFTLI